MATKKAATKKAAKTPTKKAAAKKTVKKAAAKKPGPKPKTWTAEQQRTFERLCEIFSSRKETAHVLGMDVRTLDKNIAASYPDTPTWEEAFERFSAVGRASLRRKQFEIALSGDRTMLIWLGKNVLGQKDDPRAVDEKPREGKLVAFEGKKLSKAN